MIGLPPQHVQRASVASRQTALRGELLTKRQSKEIINHAGGST